MSTRYFDSHTMLNHKTSQLSAIHKDDIAEVMFELAITEPPYIPSRE